MMEVKGSPRVAFSLAPRPAPPSLVTPLPRERLYGEHMDEFERILTISGRERAYFPMSRSDITNGAKPIGSSGYYVATHFGADQVTKLCYQVVGLFGYPKDSFTVEAP